MTRRFVGPVSVRLADEQAERVRLNHDQRIRELQGLPGAQLGVISDVVLANGVETPVAHKLGRPPRWVRESCVRGAATPGSVEEVRNGSHDRSEVVVLKATGWGATIVVDVAVM